MKITIAAGAYKGTWEMTAEVSAVLASVLRESKASQTGDYSAICAVMELGQHTGQIHKIAA